MKGIIIQKQKINQLIIKEEPHLNITSEGKIKTRGIYGKVSINIL
jgi:hypothetical protein